MPVKPESYRVVGAGVSADSEISQVCEPRQWREVSNLRVIKTKMRQLRQRLERRAHA